MQYTHLRDTLYLGRITFCRSPRIYHLYIYPNRLTHQYLHKTFLFMVVVMLYHCYQNTMITLRGGHISLIGNRRTKWPSYPREDRYAGPICAICPHERATWGRNIPHLVVQCITLLYLSALLQYRIEYCKWVSLIGAKMFQALPLQMITTPHGN